MPRDENLTLQLAILQYYFVSSKYRPTSIERRVTITTRYLLFSKTRSNKKNEEEDGKNRFLEPDRSFFSPSVEHRQNSEWISTKKRTTNPRPPDNATVYVFNASPPTGNHRPDMPE